VRQSSPTVLFFDGFPRATEHFLFREAKGLTDSGREIVIAALHREPSVPLPFPCKGIWGNDHAPIDRMWSLLTPSLSVAALEILDELGPRGFAFIARRPSSFGKMIRRLRGAAQIHSMHAGFCGLAGYALSRALDVPFSFSCHARDVFVQTDVLAFLVPRARRVVTCWEGASDFVRARFPQHADRVVMIHHPAPQLDFAPGRIGKRLVAVGRDVPKKGLPLLLTAFAMAREKEPGLELELIGPLIAETGLLPEGVRVSGILSHAETHRRMSASSVLVHFSRVAADGDRDGIPNVIVEAMMLGLPVVAANAGGVAEVVLDGRTGMLVSSREPGQFADAIVRMVRSSDGNSALAENARKMVEQQFDPPTQVASLAAALDSALQPL